MNISDKIGLYAERLTLRTLLVAAVFAFLGIGFFLFATVLPDLSTLQILARELGALLFVSGVITVLWDSFAKRALLDEILAKARLSKDIEVAGLSGIHPLFQSEALDWDSYFSTSRSLDLFFISAYGWRGQQFRKIERFLNQEDTNIRIVLPDLEDDEVVSELARRFDDTTEQVKSRISEAQTYFEDLGSTHPGKINIWFLPAAHQLSFYVFDQTAILALSSHRKGQISVPTFVCEKEGYLYNYLRSEFDTMVCSGGLARLVTRHSETGE